MDETARCEGTHAACVAFLERNGMGPAGHHWAKPGWQGFLKCYDGGALWEAAIWECLKVKEP